MPRGPRPAGRRAARPRRPRSGTARHRDHDPAGVVGLAEVDRHRVGPGRRRADVGHREHGRRHALGHAGAVDHQVERVAPAGDRRCRRRARRSRLGGFLPSIGRRVGDRQRGDDLAATELLAALEPDRRDLAPPGRQLGDPARAELARRQLELVDQQVAQAVAVAAQGRRAGPPGVERARDRASGAGSMVRADSAAGSRVRRERVGSSSVAWSHHAAAAAAARSAARPTSRRSKKPTPGNAAGPGEQRIGEPGDLAGLVPQRQERRRRAARGPARGPGPRRRRPGRCGRRARPAGR